ncbi:MAG: hypothetical protein CML02_08505 [Pseudooceanicola sp.]|jgi:hypothetical protein|nr:hypothetical protein [Pseudooceanicola sp.]
MSRRVPLTVPAGERGVLRLFALDMPREQVRFLRDEPAALADKLGLSDIALSHVDFIRPEDLGELGLSGYLIDGCGVPADQIAPDRSYLAEREGPVIVVLSRAFGGAAVTLKPGSGVVPFASYTRPGTDWSGDAPTSEAALPGSGPAPQSPRDARSRARRIGGGLFAICMILIALGLWALFG